METSSLRTLKTSLVDPHHIDADPDVDPDLTYHPGGDPVAGSDFYLMQIWMRIQILASK
jgi:hypothetical protein